MFGIRKTFRRLFGRGAADAFNSVVAYLNNLCGDESIDFHRPDSPSAENPPCIAVSKTWLNSALYGFVKLATGATTANVLIGTDANGLLKNVANLLTTAPTTDKVLTVKKNGTTVTWEDAGGGAAENPSSTTSLANAAPGTATVNSTTWTAGGTKGVVVRQHTRTMWDGTNLYGFYRDFVFDKNGRLYTVSGETRYTIDTPTKITWN
jgi:hypothetical protein